MAMVTPGRPKHIVKVVPPSQQRMPIKTPTRSAQLARYTPPPKQPRKGATQPAAQAKQRQQRKKPDKVDVTVRRYKGQPDFVTNGSATVKIEFLIGLALIVLSPIGNPLIHSDQNYLKRIISWIMIFMILFPMSGSNKPGLVRLANATGAVILLTISVRGTRSGFGVDVPTLLNTIVGKIQPSAATSPTASAPAQSQPPDAGPTPIPTSTLRAPRPQ